MDNLRNELIRIFSNLNSYFPLIKVLLFLQNKVLASFEEYPNKKNCSFPSKNLCGVGVMFYVLLALRIAFRTKNKESQEPVLVDLLDLVALGTVADLVPLDFNNRILVSVGIKIIRSGI